MPDILAILVGEEPHLFEVKCEDAQAGLRHLADEAKQYRFGVIILGRRVLTYAKAEVPQSEGAAQWLSENVTAAVHAISLAESWYLDYTKEEIVLHAVHRVYKLLQDKSEIPF